MKASGTTTSPPPIYESDVDATDAARDLASLHDVDLRKVTGTGADGRITKDDVLAVVDQQD